MKIKLKTMNENQTTSGSTEMDRPQYIYIQEIYDESYDEEMMTYEFCFYTYSGSDIHLRLRKKDIERFMLFMKKEEAHHRYFKHIVEN